MDNPIILLNKLFIISADGIIIMIIAHNINDIGPLSTGSCGLAESNIGKQNKNK